MSESELVYSGGSQLSSGALLVPGKLILVLVVLVLCKIKLNLYLIFLCQDKTTSILSFVTFF